MAFDNLDLTCAKVAADLISRAGDTQMEKLCGDATAVLSANGPYAFYLYLWALWARDSKPAKAVIDTTFAALIAWFPVLGSKALLDRKQMLDKIAALSEDLDSLLLAKKLLSRILTYARYHAKAGIKPQRAASAS